MPYDLKAFADDLAFLVNIDSGSRCIDGVNTVTDWFAARFQSIGWHVTFFEPLPGTFGRSALATNHPGSQHDLLIISHTDTVFPDGTAKARPFSVSNQHFHGPGVADMKAGCLTAWLTLSHLHATGQLTGRVAILFNGEHELSCPTIRPTIEALSKQSAFVITTEPARADGACVRQRKGILRFSLNFHGRSAHSGVEPERGRCAVTELARFILDIKALENPAAGISVNPGIVSGGTSVNAIPAAAECRLDIRTVTLEAAQQLDAAVRERAAKPADPDVRIALEGGITRPPMLPTPRSDAVIARINEAAQQLGIQNLKWTFSGGGSDASFASAFGIPALCGLGPVGGGYHTDKEFVDTGDLLQRIQLFEHIARNLTNATW